MRKATGATIFSLAGLLLLLMGLAGLIYPAYGEWRHNLNFQPPFIEPMPAVTMEIPTPAPSPSPTPVASPTPWRIELVQPEATPTPTTIPTPSATPTPLPAYGPATYMTSPSIQVESKVVEAPIQNGEYTVPLYDVGHHQGAPNPGEIGNSIYVGHVATISAGHVFQRLSEVKPGDVVYVLTPTHRTDWVVYESKPYSKDDVAFLSQGPNQEITLYTCHGTWDWVNKDYDQRWVVKGKLVKVEPRENAGG